MRPDPISEIRRGMQAAPRARLVEWAVSGRPEFPKELSRAVAAWLLIQGRHARTLREGKRHARLLLRVLKSAAAGRSSSQRHLRDAYMTVGNMHFRFNDPDTALAYYQRTRIRERDPDRLALARLNIARLHLAEGRFYEALDAARRSASSKVSRREVASGLALVRARVFLTLGYDDDAVPVIRETKDDVASTKMLLVEHRYLGLMARVRFADRAAFGRRMQEFLTWVGRATDEATGAFYEAELLLVGSVLTPDAVTNRRNWATRLAFLVKKANIQQFGVVFAALTRFLAIADPTIAQEEAVLDVMGEFARSSHHLTFQLVAILLAENLVDRRQFALAMRLLALLAKHWDVLASGFSQTTLARLAQRPSARRLGAAALEARIATALGKPRSDASAWLFT